MAYLQYIIPQHLFSRFIGLFTDTQYPLIKDNLIDWFIKRYQVDMSCALRTDPRAYHSFNDFFTRTLKVDARPFVTRERDIACPVDGVVSQLGLIKEGRIFQAKGFNFTVTELLGGSAERAAPFSNGEFTTLYLSPRDYHRIHMPIDGRLKEMIYIPGKLFSVNPATAASVPRLFARNERVVALFDTKAGPMAIVLVGAMIVASINTVWHGEVTPPKQKAVTSWSYTDDTVYQRGDEIGHFKLGSTVLVLFGPNAVEWNSRLAAESPVQLGQLLGSLK